MLNKTVNLDNCLAGFLLTARDRQHLLRRCLFSSPLFRRHSDARTFASTNYRCAKESASLSSPLGLTTCALLRDNAMAFLCLFWQARTLPRRSCRRPCREKSLPRSRRCRSRRRSSRPLFPSQRRRAFLGAFARRLSLSRPRLFRCIHPAVVVARMQATPVASSALAKLATRVARAARLALLA